MNTRVQSSEPTFKNIKTKLEKAQDVMAHTFNLGAEENEQEL